jgi:manganese/zinc/iron transport system permease protein
VNVLAYAFSWDRFWETLTLQTYNTRIVVVGTTLLGLAAGVVGTFAYLRRRALMSDALSHATLPGMALAYVLTQTKSLTVLMTGAALSGTLGVLAVMGLRLVPRIKEDTAIGLVLSVFFGIGLVLMSVIQSMNTGTQAGLETFIYGKAAAMLRADAMAIGITATIVIATAFLFIKEFRLLCFDRQYAATQGLAVGFVDLVMMALVVLTTVIGLQAVGLILIIALLIIPAATARFWTDDLIRMIAIAATVGALSGWSGSTISAQIENMPTGAIIVVCSGVLFTVSMLVAPRRGVLASALRQATLNRRIQRQHLLRAMAEHEEVYGSGTAMAVHDIRGSRSWSPGELNRVLRRCARLGDITIPTSTEISLKPSGRAHAERVLRNHRLWELFLIHYADIAPSHVDRDADEVEHVLSDEIIRDLESALDAPTRTPPSPHDQVQS